MSGASESGLVAAGRGALCRCPACGKGRLFGRFLKVAPSCPCCGAVLSHHRADDFPPYIVMFVVGHLVGYGIYASDIGDDAAGDGLRILGWIALALVLSLGLLQPAKGFVVGLQYALGMHGFGRASNLGTRPRALNAEAEGERREGAGADRAPDHGRA